MGGEELVALWAGWVRWRNRVACTCECGLHHRNPPSAAAECRSSKSTRSRGSIRYDGHAADEIFFNHVSELLYVYAVEFAWCRVCLAACASWWPSFRLPHTELPVLTLWNSLPPSPTNWTWANLLSTSPPYYRNIPTYFRRHPRNWPELPYTAQYWVKNLLDLVTKSGLFQFCKFRHHAGCSTHNTYCTHYSARFEDTVQVHRTVYSTVYPKTKRKKEIYDKERNATHISIRFEIGFARSAKRFDDRMDRVFCISTARRF